MVGIIGVKAQNSSIPVFVTAHIIYKLPDHHQVLQDFIWQHEDVVPNIPRLLRFLRFWEHEIEGPLHAVTVAYKGLVTPHELTLAQLRPYLN